MLSHWQVSNEEATAKPYASPPARQPTSAPTATSTPEPSTWQADVVAAYTAAIGDRKARLRGEFGARIQDLTGCSVLAEAIMVDDTGHWATLTLDGLVFQLRGHDLIVLRPCAHCGVGRFESLSLCTQADLGYALAGWRPYHADCEPVDPEEAW
jgi:hypothetical protein